MSLMEIQIERFGGLGKGIGLYEHKVIMVDHAMPGDKVEARIYKRKKKYAIAKIHNLLEASADRIEPLCKHFGTCGGCTWQHLEYAKQLEYKQEEICSEFRKISHLENIPFDPIAPCKENYHYRNKLEFTFSPYRWLEKEELESAKILEKRALGFHIPGSFDKILEIQECYLQDPLSNHIRNYVAELAKKIDLPFYDAKYHRGVLRNLILRNNLKGEFMLVLQLGAEPTEEVFALLERIKEHFPKIVSAYYIVNTKKNDSYTDLEPRHYFGDVFLEENLGDIAYKIGPKSFFQTNTKQTITLYDIVKSFAGITKQDIVYDLYCGIGAISLYLSKLAHRVVGMEYVNEAVQDAYLNAKQNDIENVCFYAGDIKDLLKDEGIIQKEGKPDIVVCDPPRAGMHPFVIERLKALRPRTIVYVSCHPASQARDIAILSSHYEIVKMQAVDMFPHTYHVENICLLHFTTS